MKIHEYQARELFGQFGIPCPKGILALTPEEAVNAAKEIGEYPVVVKAQIHSGGRGKAGGDPAGRGREGSGRFEGHR